jgi:hypothetical protein
MQVDLGRSATYAFEDAAWLNKLVVLFIVGFVPGLNLIVWSGYALSIARNVARGERLPLPGWEAWPEIAVRGLLSLAATAAYLAPALVGLLALTALPAPGLALRCAALLAIAFYVAIANYLLQAGHARYAQTDQAYHYGELRSRLADLRAHAATFAALYAYLVVLSLLLLLFALVVGALALVMLSVIFTSGGLVGFLLIFILALSVLVVVAVTTLAFVANGFILGAAVRALPDAVMPL